MLDPQKSLIPPPDTSLFDLVQVWGYEHTVPTVKEFTQVITVFHMQKVGSGGARLLKSSATTHFLNSSEFKTLHERWDMQAYFNG